jgi:hypothetical protein
MEYHRGATPSGSGQPGRWATSTMACAANASARMVSACRGSRTNVVAATTKNPAASATSKPTPGCASWATARPMYAPADSANSNAANCANRSSATRRSGELTGTCADRRACHVTPEPIRAKATTLVWAASVTLCGSVLQVVQRVDSKLGGINGRDDRGLFAVAGRFP